MEYKEYRDIRLSRLGYGCMRFPLRQGSQTEIDGLKAEKLLDKAFSEGINYYDTAFPYHGRTCEAFVGRALVDKHPRGSFYLATKLPVFSIKTREEAESIFSRQLENLRTDYFDFYLLHAMNAERFENVKKLGLYDMLREKQAEGRIRFLGFSFHDSPEVLERILGTWSFDFAQIQLNYLDWVLQNAQRQYQILYDRRIPVMVMEPVRGGALMNLPGKAEELLRSVHPDWSLASWALRWAAALPGVQVILSGMTTEGQLEDNLRTFSDSARLEGEEEEALEEARDILLSANTIKCTACRYCLPCTKGIVIPSLFAAYNSYLLSGDRESLVSAYKAEKVPGSACVDCLKCVKACPQKLQVNKLVKDVDKTARAWGA